MEFSLAKKKAPARSVGVQHEEKAKAVEYVTGVAGNEIEGTSGDDEPVRDKVIARIENTFEVGTGRRRKVRGRKSRERDNASTDDDDFRAQIPSFIPTKDEIERDNKRFHVAETIAAGGELAQQGVAYGLTKMGPKHGAVAAEKSDRDKAGESFIGKSLHEKELQAFKEDMEDLPEQASIEEYEDMPIEDFGKAMLRGMGWEEGKAVGRMHRGMVEAVEFIPRAARLGLGAQPAEKDAPQKKYIKPGETREKKADMVRDQRAVADAGMRNVKTLDEKLVKRKEVGPREGKMMYIADGQHAGISGRILRMLGEKASIELSNSGTVVTVRCSELQEMSERETKASVGEKRFRNDDSKSAGTAAEPWLYTNVRVRVVSKSFSRGQFYLMKGVIVDVLTPTKCLLQIDGGGKTIEIDQRALETVLPKLGGRICVVLGKFRGRRGKLLEKNKSNDTASIQLNEDFEAHVLPMDAIAEYSGALDEED
ncbi:G-patch nucleic acid binding protein [Ostreococcus tauri]|uniref:G-patch nucleic acid binding protein n=1 Tax=Ostreococcus tauri TaxID=70448 RepID=A0A1Y5I2S6_OSTTA|nr:G-patch nucleic acid binding protein [Ostreococcus tauri]